MAIKHLTCALALSALAACGGGGDSQAPAGPLFAASPSIAEGCAVEPQAAGVQGPSALVQSDVYTFPQLSGTQDRTYTPAAIYNGNPLPTNVQVALSATRRLETPAGLAGTTGLDLFVELVNTTTGDVSRAPTNGCERAISGQGPAASTTVTELKRFTISIPAGHTVIFRTVARVSSADGSTQPITLTTTDFDFSVTHL